MTEPSATLKRLFNLVKVVIVSAVVFGIVVLVFSVVWHPRVTTEYHSQALISLTKVRRQKVGQVNYVRYSNGSELTQLFSDTFKAPTTSKALRRELKKAGLAAELAQPGKITVHTSYNSGLIQINVTDDKRKTAIKAANLAATVAVKQFEKQYRLKNSRVIAHATSADRWATTISRSELIMKFMFAGILLGFLWMFVRELWQRHVTSR